MPDRISSAFGGRFAFNPGIVFALAAFVILLILNLIYAGETLSFENLPATLGLALPLILVAFAVVPTMLVGNGGIDLSVGPTAGLVNVIVVYSLIGQAGVSSPPAVIAVALGVGLAVGLFNGLIVAYLRIQPIVATLGTYLICSGLALSILPGPGGSVPGWLADLAEGASIIPIVCVLVLWLLIRRTPFYTQLIATSDDERAAFTSGIDPARIRVAAYALSGMLAAVAGLALSAVLGSADASVGPRYTLAAIAAAVFGGVSLSGSEGGMLNALLGAAAIFLLQNMLTSLHTSSFLLQVVYGAALVIAVAINGRFNVLSRRWGQA